MPCSARWQLSNCPLRPIDCIASCKIGCPEAPMKLHHEFTVAQPTERVWQFFHDIPAVASCIPGAEYLGVNEGRHAGRVAVRAGPFQASFEGDAEIRYDDAARSIVLEGSGIDRKGASRGKLTLNCLLAEAGEATSVAVATELRLSGTIAQFGRTGLIAGIADELVAQFIRNTEAEMSKRTSRDQNGPDGSDGQ